MGLSGPASAVCPVRPAPTLQPTPPLALLEFDAGDEALSPVGDLEELEARMVGEEPRFALEFEVREAMEKWAAAAAAAAGNKNGILGA
jgi:hypothetical protein